MPTVALVFIFISIAVIAYLLGSVNPSIVISKMFFRKDIRTLGSGNAGLTNMYRNFGTVPALFALIYDPGKAVLSVYLGQILSKACGLDPIYGAYLAAVFVVLGHLYPCFFKLRGGKGVLTMAGAIALIHPHMLLIGLGIFLVVILFTKYVSLGSILSCGTLFIQIIVFAAIKNDFGGSFYYDLIFSIILSGIILFTHRSNISRLIHGTERKITDKKKKPLDSENIDAESDAIVGETENTEIEIPSEETNSANDKK